jgi:hypothetical protein
LLIGSVHDLDAPASPILTFLIPFRDHVLSLGDSSRSRRLKVRIPVPFGIFDEAVFGPDVEVVQRRFCPLLRRSMRLAGWVTCARRTALIIPPLEIVTLARVLWSFAHAERLRRAAGFLMSNDMLLFSRRSADGPLLLRTEGRCQHPVQMSFEISLILRSLARSMASAFCRALAANAADSSAEYACDWEEFGPRASGAALPWAVAAENVSDTASRTMTVVIRMGALLQEHIRRLQA